MQKKSSEKGRREERGERKRGDGRKRGRRERGRREREEKGFWGRRKKRQKTKAKANAY
jgi:hypothetical protein